MRHTWDDASDQALRRAHDAMAELDLPRGVLWPAVAGALAKEDIRITPAAASSRMYRLRRAEEAPEPIATPEAAEAADDAWARAEEAPEPIATPEAAEAADDAWARAERLVEEYEQSEREALAAALEGTQVFLGRVEASTIGMEGRLGLLEERFSRVEASLGRLVEMWQ